MNKENKNKMNEGNDIRKNQVGNDKKYFGYGDLLAHSEKWTNIAIISIFVILLSFFGQIIYDKMKEVNCEKEVCIELGNSEDEIKMIKEKENIKVENIGPLQNIQGLTYRLYKEKEGVYVLVGWLKVEENKYTYRDIVKGVEEKEMIPTGENGEYVFVWGTNSEKLTLQYDDGREEVYLKEINETRLIKTPGKDFKVIEE